MSDGSQQERGENARWEELLTLAESSVDDRPVMTSEYCHGMGNAMGNLDEYWQEIYSHPRMLGGFLWDWADQGLYREYSPGKRFIAYGGDFGDRPNLKAFCLNGIVFADRGLTPKYHEVKKVYQQVEFQKLQHTAGGMLLQVVNRFNHRNLNEFEFRWQLLSGGRIVKEGVLDAPNIAPGDLGTLSILSTLREPVPTGEDAYVRISVHTLEATPWAEAGYELAWEQFPYPDDHSLPPKLKSINAPGLSYTQTKDRIAVVGWPFIVEFDRQKGGLDSLSYFKREMLSNPNTTSANPVAQFYRAPTDNDRGFGNWLAKNWKLAGLDSPERSLVSCRLKNSTAKSVEVLIETEYKFTTGSFRHLATWKILGDGTLNVSNKFTPSGSLPPLPRVGVRLVLNPALENLSWYGHGPHENYSDRKQSSPLGVWKSTVTQQYVPYPKPQETGNKEGVRWLALTDKSGQGLAIVCEQPISASALHFTVDDLATATHAYELKPRDEVILSLDAAHCGLGE